LSDHGEDQHPMTIGTLNWTRRGGVLTLSERWRLTLAAIHKHLALHMETKGGAEDSRVSLLRRLGPNALQAIDLPRDPVACAASAAAMELQPAWLANHCLRSYAWASLLALERGQMHDKSLLFVACMLHDLGLTPSAANPADECFTLRGARKAAEILGETGATKPQVDCVCEAITLHLNIEVGVEQGIEAHLLQAGAGFDVVGQRYNEIPAAVRQPVLERYPRLGMKREFCSCALRERRNAPNTRMGLYVRRLGFLELIRKAPYDE
jgi:hypothetical protein